MTRVALRAVGSRAHVLLTCVAALVVVAGCGRACEPLEIDADGAPVITLCATRTQTEAELRGGLSLRPPLAPDEALVLVLPFETEACITNAPVSYAIDAAFLDATGRVLGVVRDVPANDEATHCLSGTARVLETRGGVLADVHEGFVAPAAR